MLRIHTPRLDLTAATPELARADILDRTAFAALLGAAVPDSWPIEVMQDAREPLAQALESGVTEPGWSLWYIVHAATLCGVVGCYGRPDAEGATTIGYGIVPEAEGRGIATEALSGVMTWARAAGPVALFRATTFERHAPSIRVLEKNGFRCVGVSPEDGQAAESDRQGRGRLMVWECADAVRSER